MGNSRKQKGNSREKKRAIMGIRGDLGEVKVNIDLRTRTIVSVVNFELILRLFCSVAVFEIIGGSHLH